MALKLTVTPSTKYIEDNINIKITGGTVPSNLHLDVSVFKYWGDVDGNYGDSAYRQEANVSSNFNITCPSENKTSPSGINYGLPLVYQEDFTLNTLKLNVKFSIIQGIQEIASVWKTMYIKPMPPTFNTVPVYQDIKSSSLALTNDNQMIVNGMSEIKINNLLGTAYKYGQLSYIRIQTKSGDIKVPYSSIETDSFITIPAFESSNKNLIVTLVDSRGLSRDYEIADISKFKYIYASPKIKNINVERNGVSEETILNADGYYSEGYQQGTTGLNAGYIYQENVSGATIYTGTTVLNISKSLSTEYDDFITILNEYINPHYIPSSSGIGQYYVDWNLPHADRPAYSELFSIALKYNNKYTEEYLENDRSDNKYYCISGGYSYTNGWHEFWRDTLEAIYDVMYENGGNYEFEIETVNPTLKGDTQIGFSMDKTFYIKLNLTQSISTISNTVTSQNILLPTAIPAIDIFKDKVALHGLYDENLGGDVQLNGEVFLNSHTLQNIVSSGNNAGAVTIGKIGIEWGSVSVTSGTSATTFQGINIYTGHGTVTFENNYKYTPQVSTFFKGNYSNQYSTSSYSASKTGASLAGYILQSNQTRTIGYIVIGVLEDS